MLTALLETEYREDTEQNNQDYTVDPFLPLNFFPQDTFSYWHLKRC